MSHTVYMDEGMTVDFDFFKSTMVLYQASVFDWWGKRNKGKGRKKKATMDYQGQKLSELLYYWIIITFGVTLPCIYVCYFCLYI